MKLKAPITKIVIEKTRCLTNSKGQGLVEYLILVALVAVASISVVKVLQNTVNVQFSNAIQSLQGKGTKKIQAEKVEERHYQKKDLSDFMKGSVNREK